MKKILSSLLGFILMISTSFAQYDSTYVTNYNQKFGLKLILYSNVIKLSSHKDGKEITYVPNSPMGIGFGYSSPTTVIDVYAFNLNYKANKNFEKSKFMDVQVHNFSPHFVYDVYYQRYKRFYIDDTKLTTNEARCPDISMTQMAWVQQYIVNNKDFSMGAGFTQNEKQVQSAGSFLIGGGIYYFEVNSDSSFNFKSKSNCSSFQVGISGGYAYNWVINPKWLLSISGTGGLNIGNKNLKSFFDTDPYLSGSLLGRISINYDFKNSTLGASFTNNTLQMSSGSSKINLSTGRIVVSYVQRFGKKNT